MAISTRSQGELFTIASWKHLDQLFAREGGLAANVYVFASLFNHSHFPALLNSLIATKTEDDQLTLDALQIIFAKVYKHPTLGQGKAFIMASLHYDLIFKEFLGDDFFNFLFYSANNYSEEEIDAITQKAFSTNFFFDIENPYSLTLNLQLTSLPEKYATQLLNQVMSDNNCWVKMMASSHGYLFNASLLLNKIPSGHSIKLCKKIFDENSGLFIFLQNSNTLVRVLNYVDPACYDFIISRITQDRETWALFLNNYEINRAEFYYIDTEIEYSKYHVILMSLNNVPQVKRLLINALKQLNISLLHMVCDQVYRKVDINDHLQYLIYLLLNGADPKWIPVGYVCNALVYVTNCVNHAVRPLSIAVRDAIIEMLKLGVDPLAGNAVFDKMLNETIHNFPRKFIDALDLGALPSSQPTFFSSKRGTIVQVCDSRVQELDKDFVLTLLTYFDLHNMSVDMKAILTQKACALFPVLQLTPLPICIPALKSQLIKLRTDYRINRDKMLIACLLYMMDYHEPSKRYYLSLLPRPVFLMILACIDAKSDSVALLNFCLANREAYFQLSQLPGTVCLFETKAFFISALSLATQYAQQPQESKAAFREYAKPHLNIHFSLFRLPAHRAALINTLQDSELFRDAYHV